MRATQCFFNLIVLPALTAHAQGTFIYDQQSATNGIPSGGGSIQQLQPIGQSFTPALSAINFVQMWLQNGPPVYTNATVVVNLWSGSIGGTLLGSTDPVSFPASFISGPTNFLFPASVALTPGTTYYLQPVIQSGGNPTWGVLNDFYNYPGGTYIFLGMPSTSGLDLWFREGQFVPEPSSACLIALGAITLRVSARRQQRRTDENPLQR